MYYMMVPWGPLWQLISIVAIYHTLQYFSSRLDSLIVSNLVKHKSACSIVHRSKSFSWPWSFHKQVEQQHAVATSRKKIATVTSPESDAVLSTGRVRNSTYSSSAPLAPPSSELVTANRRFAFDEGTLVEDSLGYLRSFEPSSC